MEQSLLYLTKKQVKPFVAEKAKKRKVVSITVLQSNSVSINGFNKPISKTIVFSGRWK